MNTLKKGERRQEIFSNQSFCKMLIFSLENEKEPCCSKNLNPVIERKVYCPICSNLFSVSTIEDHADLCLENKNKFLFERQTERSDEEKSLSMIDKKTEIREHLDQTQLVPAIYRQLQRASCFKDFLKTFEKT